MIGGHVICAGADLRGLRLNQLDLVVSADPRVDVVRGMKSCAVVGAESTPEVPDGRGIEVPDRPGIEVPDGSIGLRDCRGPDGRGPAGRIERADMPSERICTCPTCAFFMFVFVFAFTIRGTSSLSCLWRCLSACRRWLASVRFCLSYVQFNASRPRRNARARSVPGDPPSETGERR